MSAILILHISLGALLLLAFVVRYIAVLAKKIAPQTGRTGITLLATALVASGVAVGIVYKAPITGACLKSLAIIGLVIALEYGLQGVARKQPSL